MSNYWDFQCVTCATLAAEPFGFSAGVRWNHGGEKLQAFVRDGGVATVGALFALRGTLSWCDLELAINEPVAPTLYLGMDGNRVDIVEFCFKHAGHRVEVMSEYGYYWGECGRRVTSGELPCCTLPEEHPGGHEHRSRVWEAGRIERG